MELGLIGFGAVARFLLEAVNERQVVPGARFTRVAVREESLDGRDPDRGVVWCTPQELVESPVDVVVEAASVEAAAQWAVPLVEAGKQVVMLSVGALVDPALRRRLEAVQVRGGGKVYVPAGAVGGLDLLEAMQMGGLDGVRLTTTKPPAALAGAPAGILYAGPATEAIRRYPQNVNVAVAVGLAGVGPESTQVVLQSDPGVTANVHQVEAWGRSGRVAWRVENRPLPDNPKTSYLAALSVLAVLKKFSEPIWLV
jgi:aspartate dehydrogenase